LPSVRKRLSPSNRVYRLGFPDAITAIPLYEAYLASRHARGAGDDATAEFAEWSVLGKKEAGDVITSPAHSAGFGGFASG
jgi:hypothetical protein